MTTTKRLSELEPGDEIKTNEGRREWLRIVTIGDFNIGCRYEDGEARYAQVEYCGGMRRGSRFLMYLHDYDKGWVVR